MQILFATNTIDNPSWNMWSVNDASIKHHFWHNRFLLDDLAGCQTLQMFQSLLLSNYGGFTNSIATDRLPFTASNSFYSCVGLFVVFGLNICNNILISTYIKGWLVMKKELSRYTDLRWKIFIHTFKLSKRKSLNNTLDLIFLGFLWCHTQGGGPCLCSRGGMFVVTILIVGSWCK